jgi:hypothetical protein
MRVRSVPWPWLLCWPYRRAYGASAVEESARRPFREYPGREYEDFPLPPDFREKAEWQFARLMYPQFQGRFGRRGGGGFRGFGGNRKDGGSSWTTDYPRADRHLSETLRLLARVHVRSVEQPVDLDDEDDVYNYPWLYAVEVGRRALTGDQAKKIRDYVGRGGFFMCDYFHDVYERAVFEASMKKVFPGRDIMDLPTGDPIFHTIYDPHDRYQVAGARHLRSG